MAVTKQLFVFATVGTDHHPFDRFVDWIDTWQSGHSECEMFVQRGSTSRIPKTSSTPFLEPGELAALMRRADTVVCHGGPSTIMEARRAGIVPIVVPRDPSKGEHVDDHQMRFTDFMAAKGAILLARTEDELAAHLESVLQGQVERIAVGSPVETLNAISSIIEELMSRPQRSILGSWMRRS